MLVIARANEAAVAKRGSVDIEGRRKVAELLRAFVDGHMTNWDLDKDYPSSSADAAVHAVYARTWRFQDDFNEFRVTGPLALTGDERELFERCILFMRTDAPYRWPSPARALALRLVSVFRISWARDELRGDRAAWPFFERAETGGSDKE